MALAAECAKEGLVSWTKWCGKGRGDQPQDARDHNGNSANSHLVRPLDVLAGILRLDNRSWLIRAHTNFNRVNRRVRIPFASSSVAVGADGVWLG